VRAETGEGRRGESACKTPGKIPEQEADHGFSLMQLVDNKKGLLWTTAATQGSPKGL
jgi:hypothetical protein